MKVAVIGSGAAGAGVILGLRRAGVAAEIDLFDNAAEPNVDPPPATGPEGLSRPQLAEIYQTVARQQGRSLPLPKSQFGYVPPRLPVNGKPRIWHSRHRGGLTNFWGGTMLPLLDADFGDWPISRRELDPYYEAAVSAVGVSGAPDRLSARLGGDFANRPPIRLHPMIARLVGAISGHGEDCGPVVAGVNRIALETRPGRDNACVFCGECLAGCFRNAPFTTRNWFEAWTKDLTIRRASAARVAAIDTERRVLTLESGHNAHGQAGPYDRVYVAAGCHGSSILLMDSLGLDEVEFGDSAVINLPIVYMGANAKGTCSRESFGLTQAIALISDEGGSGTAAQAQIYPTLPHFWRSVAPTPLWGLAGLAGVPLKARLLWARTYLADKTAVRYNVRRGVGPSKHYDMHAPAIASAKSYAVKQLSQSLEKTGFTALGALAGGGGSSSHYASAKPFVVNQGIVDSSFQITEGVYLTDSAAWPSVPAMSPTLTIMANAMRIAEHSV